MVVGSGAVRWDLGPPLDRRPLRQLQPQKPRQLLPMPPLKERQTNAKSWKNSEIEHFPVKMLFIVFTSC